MVLYALGENTGKSLYNHSIFNLQYHSIWPVNIWATTRENIPSDMCAQQRYQSGSAFAQSDQSLHCLHEKTLNPWLCKMCPVKILIRLMRMCSLIWIFSVCTYPKICFLPALVAQLDAPADWRPGRGFNPRRDRQHSFLEIDHEIFLR